MDLEVNREYGHNRKTYAQDNELELTTEDQLRKLLIDALGMKVQSAATKNEFEFMSCRALMIKMALDLKFE